MDAALEGFLTQWLAVEQDLPGLAGPLAPAQFNWQPASGQWSIGQCVEHLNITTERYLPVLRGAIDGARAKGRFGVGPYTLGFLERWFLGQMEPPIRHRIRTRKGFVPPSSLEPAATVSRFRTLHGEFAQCIRSADGLDLRAIKVRSQFGPVRWSLNGTFAILLAHERRHIWQARQVRGKAGFPGD
jgi:hypothetical protein